MDNIKILLIGCGYWGRNWFKTIRDSKHSLVGVVDPSPSVPVVNTPLFSSIEDVNVEYTHAIIAVPAQFHAQCKSKLKIPDENILVEKPCGLNLDDSASMGNIYPGFLFLHSPQYKQIKSNLKEIGEPIGYHSRRCSMGPRIRTDVSIIEDYLVHDLYMFTDLFGSQNMQGVKLMRNNFKAPILSDEICVFLEREKLMANMFSSWWYPVKTRSVVIIGTKGSFVWENDKVSLTFSSYHETPGETDVHGNHGYNLIESSMAELDTYNKKSNLELELDAFVEKNKPFSDTLLSDTWNLIRKIKA